MGKIITLIGAVSSEWTARFPGRWIYVSFGLGLLTLAIATNSAINSIDNCSFHIGGLASISIDAIIPWAIGMLQLTYIVVRSTNRYMYEQGLFRVIVVIAFEATVLIIANVLMLWTSELLKVPFDQSRPCLVIQDPPITSFIRKLISYNSEAGTSTPSGFVVRQTWLCLAVFWSLDQKITRASGSSSNGMSYDGPFDRRCRVIHRIIAVILMLLVGTDRFLSGSHRIVDIGLAVAVSLFVYWSIAIVIPTLLKNKYQGEVSSIAVLAVVYLPLFMVYSAAIQPSRSMPDTRLLSRAHWWGWALAVGFPLLAITRSAASPLAFHVANRLSPITGYIDRGVKNLAKRDDEGV